MNSRMFEDMFQVRIWIFFLAYEFRYDSLTLPTN